MPEYQNILSSYNPETDFEQLEALKMPFMFRWNSAVEMHQTGLPTQDAMRADPDASDSEIKHDLEEFWRRIKMRGRNEVPCFRFGAAPGVRIPPSHKVLTEDL
ncbi:MAG: hypothetical protein LBL46_04270, partial [Rickettsiales bacterium]|nr:hypothetical protein [Rickettsiales bacterium]